MVEQPLPGPHEYRPLTQTEVKELRSYTNSHSSQATTTKRITKVEYKALKKRQRLVQTH